MDIQADLKWIHKELDDVQDPLLIEVFENLLSYRRKVKNEDYQLTEEHKQMLDDRLKTHKLNPESGKSWAEIKSELQKKYDV